MDHDSLEALWIQTFPGLDLESRDPQTLRGSFRPQETISSAPTRAGAPENQHTLPMEAGAPSPRAEPPGFALGSILGEGGMGVVYRAEQRALRRPIALKTFKGQGPGARERFLSEALVTAILDHPNIVPIHDLQEGADELFLAMKLIDGRSWRQALDEDRPWEKAEHFDAHLDVVLAVANAIAYAHHKGFLHLDLKPENVMVGAYGEVLVLDWGLAHAHDPAQAELAPLASELVTPCGTPCFMPPELVQGQGSRLGPAADVYLLGGLLSEMLCGRPPHDGDSLMAVLEDAVDGLIVVLDERWPRQLDAIVGRCLAKDPGDRYPDVAAFQKALRDFRAQRESIIIADKAAARLDDSPLRARRLRPAQARALYADLARSIAGFDQALELWPGNHAALEGRGRARKQYAAAALAADDLGLAEDLLGALDEPDAFLTARLEEAQLARRRAEDVRRWSRGGFMAAAAVIVIGAALSVFFIDRARRRALEQQALAGREQQRAVAALDASRRNLARAFYERGLARLNRRAALSAELLLTQSLVLSDRSETREALLEARRIPLRQLWAVPRLPHGAQARALWIDPGGRFAARLEAPSYRALHIGALRPEFPGPLSLFEATPEHGDEAFRGLVFHPRDPDKVLTASPRGLEMWSIGKGHRVAAFTTPVGRPRALDLVGLDLALTRRDDLTFLRLDDGHRLTEPRRCLGPSAAGGERVFVSDDSSIAVVQSGSPTLLLMTGGPVKALSADARGRYLAVRKAKEVALWDLAARPPKKRLLPGAEDGALSLSGDGALLAMAGREGIALYRGETLLRRIRTQGRPVHALAFAREERVLVAALGSGIAAWEIGLEPQAGRVDREVGPGEGLALTEEIEAVAAGRQVELRLRDGGASLGSLPRRRGPILSLGLSPERRSLDVRAADGLRSWSVPMIIEVLTAAPGRLAEAAVKRSGLEVAGFAERPRQDEEEGGP